MMKLTSSESRRRQLGALRWVARFLGCLDEKGRGDPYSVKWWEFTSSQTTVLMAAAIDHYSPQSANNVRAAIRRVLHECWAEGKMSAEQRDRAREIHGAKVDHGKAKAGRVLSDDEIDALFRACQNDNSPAGRRDAAILAVLLCGGLRRKELVDVDLADYRAGEDVAELVVRSGKGGKTRRVYLSTNAIVYVADWIAVRGRQEGPMFWKIGKSGAMTPERFSGDALAKLLETRTDEARGILKTLNPAAEFPPWSPHDARRTYCTRLIDSSKDLHSVCDLMGHASPETTKRYDRRGERAKRQAAATLSLPLRRGNSSSHE
jgi:site-specific recombinase XerD